MVTDGNYAYHGEHCVMHGIVKSLFHTSETNITFYVKCTSIKKEIYVQEKF